MRFVLTFIQVQYSIDEDDVRGPLNGVEEVQAQVLVGVGEWCDTQVIFLRYACNHRQDRDR